MGHTTANVINDAFRGYEDDTAGAITAQTAIAAVDTNWTQAVDTKFHVAMLFTETAGGSQNVAPQLEYNHNSGGWNAISGTSPIQTTTPTNCTTTDATSYGTTALTTGATIGGTEYSTDGLGGNQSVSSSSAEFTTCVTIDSAQVADTDTIQLRITDSGTPLNADTTIPTITVSEAAGSSIAPLAVHHLNQMRSQ